MRNNFLIVLFALVAEATNRTIEKLVDELFDRLLKLGPLHSSRARTPTWSVGSKIAASPLFTASTYRRAKPGRLQRYVQLTSRGTEIARAESSAERASHPGDRSDEVRKVLWMLREGNARYMDPNRSMDAEFLQDYKLQDAWSRDQKVHVLLVKCPTVFVKASDIFQVKGNQFIRTVDSFGNLAQPFDAVIGSVEYMLSEKNPPVIVVMGNSHNYAVRAAVYRALKERNASTGSLNVASFDGYKEDETALVDLLLPSAMDAVRQQPHGSVRRLCELAGHLNVFRTIGRLFRSSKTVRAKVAAGELQIHGAYMDQRNGKVLFLGEHPLKEDLLHIEDEVSRFVRTGGAAAVPADEAHARLVAGNRRFAHDHSGNDKEALGVKRLQQLAAHGQNPLAVLLGCSDSRAPTETVFDARPGDVFVIRNAGNMCENATLGIGCSTIGSAEYAIGVLGTRLLVVMGHTDCGAVEAAVEKVLEAKARGATSTIAGMLGNMQSSAEEAVQRESGLDKQVQLASTLSIYETIAKLITGSEIIGGALLRGELEIHGAMYNITTGTVRWLGSHRDLERLLGKRMPLHTWKESPHISGQFTLDYFGGFMGREGELIYKKEPRHEKAVWSEALIKLKLGNTRFLQRKPINKDKPYFTRLNPNAKPSSMVLSGAECPASIRRVFDAGPTEMIVQKTVGNIAGTSMHTTLIASVEYAMVTFSPKLILVLGESDSEIIKLALRHVSGEIDEEFPKSFGTILNRLSVPAARALRDVEEGDIDTSAGGKSKLQRVAVELNALYYIEKLLVNSEVVRHAVKTGQLEIQAAVLNDRSLEVDFLGPHPMQDEIILGDSLAPAPFIAPSPTPPPPHVSAEQQAFLEKKMEEEMRKRKLMVADSLVKKSKGFQRIRWVRSKDAPVPSR